MSQNARRLYWNGREERSALTFYISASGRAVMATSAGSRRLAPDLLRPDAARLWEKRDRQQGLLTRRAYEEIGGVSGSLSHHAEATLEQLGRDRVPVVRELFHGWSPPRRRGRRGTANAALVALAVLAVAMLGR